jgi:polygalacturonase
MVGTIGASEWRPLLLLSLFLAFAGAAHAQNSPAVAPPAAPTIPSRVFKATDFGAVADGKTMNTAALQRMIAACEKAGGGTVLLAGGRFLTGPLTLGSSMDLQIDTGATMAFTDDPKSYRFSGNRYENCLVANDAHDIAITGGGAIDGQGAAWWETFRRDKNAPSPGPAHRPYLVVLSRCTRVLVEGVHLINSPSFHLVPDACRDVTIRAVHITAPANAPNTDGIDPSGLDFAISGCTIDVGDDCIALKPSHKVAPERASCENFVISGCTFLHGHGMSIGGQTPGGLRGLVVRDCTFSATVAGIRLKAGRGAGGVVEDATYERLTMHDVKTPIQITSYYPKIPAEPIADPAQAVTATTPVWRHLRIRNLTADGAAVAGEIIGLPEMPVSDVLLTNVHIKARRGFRIIHARGIRFENSSIEVEQGPPITTQDAEATGLAKSAELPVTIRVGPGRNDRFATIQAALDSLPADNAVPITVLIAPGIYPEALTIARGRNAVTLTGAGPDSAAVRITVGAGQTALTANGDDLTVENLTLENTAGSTAGPNRALESKGDRQVYRSVALRGWQDTLWAREAGARMYFEDCEISGSVDFIYGAGVAVFDRCRIVERRPAGGVLTAPSTLTEQPYGLVFLGCRLVNGSGGTANTTLGRPWRPFGAAAFLHCVFEEHLRPEGWRSWDGREATCRFSEFDSRTPTGAAVDTSHRAPFGHVLTAVEAAAYTLTNVFRGWDPTHTDAGR